MKLIKPVLLLVLVLGGAALITVIGINHSDKNAELTMGPAFQLAGKSTQLLDRAAAKVIPVNALDEKELGDLIAGYAYVEPEDSVVSLYLTSCMTYVASKSKKPFVYRVFVYPSSVPNAFAMPGGVIYATRGLVSAVQSESELISVLAHEMGHIELGHCFDAVKFELLARKIHQESLGQIVDMSVALLLRHSFSKTQENEADEYAFYFMGESQYDPRGQALAFSRLLDSTRVPRGGDVIEEYFATHPALELRITRFRSDAEQWWNENPGEKRYVGKQNLAEKRSFLQTPYATEWTSDHQN